MKHVSSTNFIENKQIRRTKLNEEKTDEGPRPLSYNKLQIVDITIGYIRHIKNKSHHFTSINTFK